MTTSRFRRPTSKSMTTVLCPWSASPVASAAAVVVLPTPPLPEVITVTLAIALSLRVFRLSEGDRPGSHRGRARPRDRGFARVRALPVVHIAGTLSEGQIIGNNFSSLHVGHCV